VLRLASGSGTCGSLFTLGKVAYARTGFANIGDLVATVAGDCDAPIAVVASFLVLCFFVAIVALPIAAGLYACAGEWPSAAACLGGSVLAALAARWLWRHHCAGDFSRAGFVS
jgi:hypothetical protein